MGIAMKKTIIIFLLLSIYSLAQENRLIRQNDRQNDLTDSLNAIRTLIGTGGIALPDSVLFSTDSTAQRTFSDLKYVDKPTLTDSLNVIRGSIENAKVFVNVKDYGALGDGITDDRNAIVSAINSLGSYGGTLMMDNSIYLISDSIYVPDGVSIIGTGKKYNYGTMIKMSDDTKNIFVMSAGGHQNISGLSTYGGNIAIKTSGFNTISDLTIQHAKIGIYLHNSLFNTIQNTYISDYGNPDSSMIGIYIDGWSGGDGDYSNANTFINVLCSYGSGGLLIERGQGNTFIGCDFENNKDYGIKIDNKNLYNELDYAPSDSTPLYAVGQHQFYGTWIENVKGSAIWIKEDNNTSFYNTTLLNTATHSDSNAAIRIDWSNQTKFVGGVLSELNVLNQAFRISDQAYKTLLDIALDYRFGATKYTDEGVQTKFTQVPEFTSVRNLFYNSEDMTQNNFSLSGNATVSASDTVNFPDANDAIMTYYSTKTLNKTFKGSVVLSGSGTCYLYITDNANNNLVYSSEITLTNTPTRYSILTTFDTEQQIQVRLFLTRAFSSTATSVTATKWQLEEITEYMQTTNSLWR